MNTLLTEDQRETLIELVKEQPILYDNSSKLYSRREIRDKIWFEIGKILEADKDVCKQSWKSMRDQYIKNVRALNKRKNYSRKYKYFDSMTFLNDFAVREKSVSSDLTTEDEEFWVELDNPAENETNTKRTFSESSMSSIEQHSPPAYKTKRQDDDIQTNHVKTEKFNVVEHDFLCAPVQKKDNFKSDRYDQFFLSLASTVREYNMPQPRWAELQCKVIKCLTNELERAAKQKK